MSLNVWCASLRVNAVFEHQIEIVEAIVLANHRPIVGQLILDGVSRSASLSHVFARAHGQPVGIAANTEVREHAAAYEKREPLRALLGREGELTLPRDFSRGEHQE